jgi:hypothetical protein
MIEAALRECKGRVCGPAGAASKLGMPRSTLESKIRSLRIDTNRFRTAYSLRTPSRPHTPFEVRPETALSRISPIGETSPFGRPPDAT